MLSSGDRVERLGDSRSQGGEKKAAYRENHRCPQRVPLDSVGYGLVCVVETLPTLGKEPSEILEGTIC